MSLSFDGRINIGDIATGRVKNVVDCLWPVIGGRPGAPDDWRVSELTAQQGDADEVGGVWIQVAAFAHDA